MTESVATAHKALLEKFTVLKAEFPGVTFGYIGNLGVDRSGPYDDRSWSIYLPHPGRVGTITDRVGSYSTERLPEMLAKWDSLVDAVRKGMVGRS